MVLFFLLPIMHIVQIRILNLLLKKYVKDLFVRNPCFRNKSRGGGWWWQYLGMQYLDWTCVLSIPDWANRIMLYKRCSNTSSIACVYGTFPLSSYGWNNCLFCFGPWCIKYCSTNCCVYVFGTNLLWGSYYS